MIEALVGAAVNKINGIKENIRNAATSWWLTKDQRDREDHVYGKQRRDALADWNMINEYNSPKNQMARFKEAGLNPNLIYGQTNEAPAVRSSTGDSSAPLEPRYTSDRSMDAYFDYSQQAAQTNQLAELANVAARDAVLKAAQTLGAIAQADKTRKDTELTDAQLQQFNALRSTTLEKAQEELRKLRADTQYTLDQNMRAAAQNSQSIKESAARILHIAKQNAQSDAAKREIEQRIKNLEKDEVLRSLDIQMRREGKMPHDGAIMRKLQEWYNGVMQGMINDGAGFSQDFLK